MRGKHCCPLYEQKKQTNKQKSEAVKCEQLGAITEYPGRNGDTTLKTLIVLNEPSQINLIHFDVIYFIVDDSYSLSILSSLFLTPYQTPLHISDLTIDYYQNDIPSIIMK